MSHCKRVSKILTAYRIQKIFFSFYHQLAEICSFPTMYNTLGLRIQEDTVKNGRTRKNACFSSNFLAVFLHHLSSQDCSALFCTVNLTLVSLQCDGIVFSWKISHWEACSGMIWPSFEHFAKICHLPSENYKNQLLGLTLNFLQFLLTWHHVGLYQRKVGTISFPNMYDTYRATCKKWRQCLKEL